MNRTEQLIDRVVAGLILLPPSPTATAARVAMRDHVRDLASFDRSAPHSPEISKMFADAIEVILSRTPGVKR